MEIKTVTVTPDDLIEGGKWFDSSRMTNADKIRAMTDEEMAATIYACPPDYAKLSEDEICIKFNDECKACWLDWLQKEADE